MAWPRSLLPALLGLVAAVLLALAFEAYRSPVMALLLDATALCF